MSLVRDRVPGKTSQLPDKDTFRVFGKTFHLTDSDKETVRVTEEIFYPTESDRVVKMPGANSGFPK